jgi:hypothetical protein
MFAPMSARLASSCSRNGIRAVATETVCRGRHVHVVDLVGETLATSPAALRARIWLSSTIRPRLRSTGVLAWAIVNSSSSSAER